MAFCAGSCRSGRSCDIPFYAADKYSAHELAGMLATIGAVNGIATVVAPIGGGALADFGGWHGIFWFLFALGVLLVIGSVRFKESLPIGQKAKYKMCRYVSPFRCRIT